MLRILVADSYPDSADSLALLLRLQGYECAVAHSGPEAIELGLSLSPDVALLDLSLDSIDGCEVARQLRRHGTIPIALTGYGDDRHRRQAAEAGFLIYLVKPVAPEQLEAILEGCEANRLHRLYDSREEKLPC
jgi:CheY-like chemotaxis protein